MSGEWQSQKLGSLAEFRNGVNFGREDEGIGTPIIKVKDFGDLHHVPIEGLDQLDRNRVRVPSNQFLKRNDILLVRSNGNPALVGRSMIFSGPDDAITFSGFSIRARVDSSKAAPAFIHYWLRSDFARSRFAREGNGTGIQNLSQGFLADLDILLPPLPEQRAIAATLGALDDKIELNRKMNATLEAMARALFRDWFVDFGPTRAKMEGRAPYLSPDLWSLFPDRLDAEGKPEGWEVFRLGDIADQHTRAVSPSENPGELFEHFSLPAFDKGQNPALDRGATIKSNKTLIPSGAILLSKLNPEIARVWLPEAPTGHTQIASTEFLAYTGKNGVGRGLLFCLFSDDDFRTMLHAMVTGTSKSHQRISPPDLLRREAIVGNAEMFRCFEDAVSPLLDRALANRSESRTLAHTRDLLLPRLMSGEIRVRDAERLVEEAG